MDDDYRPDLHGRVEATYRTDPPAQELVDEALKIECPDCNVNVFLEEDPEVDGQFKVIVAHDETCPELARKEKGN